MQRGVEARFDRMGVENKDAHRQAAFGAGKSSSIFSRLRVAERVVDRTVLWGRLPSHSEG